MTGEVQSRSRGGSGTTSLNPGLMKVRYDLSPVKLPVFVKHRTVVCDDGDEYDGTGWRLLTLNA